MYLLSILKLAWHVFCGMYFEGVGLPVIGLGAMLSSELAKGAPVKLGKCAAASLKLAGEVPAGISSTLTSSKVMIAGVIAVTIGTAIPAAMI
jgi:hypothetical protein